MENTSVLKVVALRIYEAPGMHKLRASFSGPAMQDVLDHLPAHAGQPLVGPLVEIRQFLVVQPHQVQDRRMQVRRVAATLDGPEPQFVGLRPAPGRPSRPRRPATCRSRMDCGPARARPRPRWSASGQTRRPTPAACPSTTPFASGRPSALRWADPFPPRAACGWRRNHCARPRCPRCARRRCTTARIAPRAPAAAA